MEAGRGSTVNPCQPNSEVAQQTAASIQFGKEILRGGQLQHLSQLLRFWGQAYSAPRRAVGALDRNQRQIEKHSAAE